MTITLDGAPGVNISMPARELGKADPGTPVTRLEHRLHHLEDRKASILADGGHAHRAIDHARESIGKAFPQAAELAQARERAWAIDEQLAQMAAPPQAGTQPGARPAPAEPETPPWFERSRGLESREVLRQLPAPQPEPEDTASPGRAPDAGYNGRSWQARDLEARRPGDVQPDAEPTAAEPAERPRPWWERTRGLELGGHEPRSGRDAASSAGPEAEPSAILRAFPELAPAAPKLDSRRYSREDIQRNHAAKREKYAAIRRDAEAGMSERAIERKHHVGRRTIVKSLAFTDPPERKKIHREPSALNGLHDHIDAMTEAEPGNRHSDDLAAPRRRARRHRRLPNPPHLHHQPTRCPEATGQDQPRLPHCDMTQPTRTADSVPV